MTERERLIEMVLDCDKENDVLSCYNERPKRIQAAEIIADHILARRSAAFRNPTVAFMTTATKTAESLYNAGYRKQSEVAKEIITEVEKCFGQSGVLPKNVGLVDFNKFDELKKKYTEE